MSSNTEIVMNHSFVQKRIFPLVLSNGLIFLFCYTASSKLVEHAAFLSILRSSPILHRYAWFVSWMIPVVEIIVAGLLFFPATNSTGLRLSLVLLILFTGYIAYMMLFFPRLPCSCGGIIQSLSWGQHLGLNIFLVFLILTHHCLPAKCPGSTGYL